jgi:nucleoid-associated protein YgaU
MALEKATITNTVTNEVVAVMFNPEDYTLSRDINYAQAAVPGLSSPILQFVNGNTPTLEMELFLDTYEKNVANGRTLNAAGEDVRDHVRKITALMDIDSDTHAPPVVIFAWGSLAFTCVLARLTQKFVMFLPSGTPVRARLQTTFHGYSNGDGERREVKRQTADYTKLHVVGQGESLARIAARVYKDAALWRPIAVHNRLEEVAELVEGTQLLIPQLPYQDPETGEVLG